ncbi:MAG: DUF2231 domain-containing protein [Candidatus Dormibacteria bacterium]
MHAKVKLFGHPIHPMLIAYPIAFYTATLVALVIYAVGGDVFWFKVGFAANVAGVAMAVLAALPGFVDWAIGIPGGTPAKSTGWQHMLLNVLALVLFAITLGVHAGQLNDASPEKPLGVILAAVGVIATVLAGFRGWALIQRHHVGIQLTTEQQRLEPEPPPTHRASAHGTATGGQS